jgi:hypothetical protein
MNRASRVMTGGLVLALGASIWLYRDNRQLRRELADARKAAPAKPAAASGAAATTASADTSSDDSAGPKKGSGAARAFLRGLGRAAERPKLEAEPKKKETRMERRLRRQQAITAMLGRLNGETEEAYRARMVPLIKMGLSRPRDRMKDARKELEKKAGIDDAQREKIDAVFDDVYKEVLDLTNKAIADGDLTPYSRNWSGVLSYAGGLGAVLGTAEGRLGGILTPEQMRIISSSGFEWGEYLGVTAPWENLNPPPPPPNNDG